MFAVGEQCIEFEGEISVFVSHLVWLGTSDAETPNGLTEKHPVCGVIQQLQEKSSYKGCWLACGWPHAGRLGELRLRTAIMKKEGWALRGAGRDAFLTRPLSFEKKWPLAESGWKFPQWERLVLGSGAIDDLVPILLHEGREPGCIQYGLARWISERHTIVVTGGRTHTDFCPGLWIVSSEKLALDTLVPQSLSGPVHHGAEAMLAWAHARVSV